MIALWIALKDVTLLLKDRKALLTLLGTPLILTLILGLALGSMWGAETPLSLVLYSNEDAGEWGEILFEEVFTLPELAVRFKLEEVEDLEAATEVVRRGGATALIHIPADFSLTVAGEGRVAIGLWGDPGDNIRVQVVEAVVHRFADEISSRRVIYETLGELGLFPGAFAEQVEEALSSLQVQALFEDGYTRSDNISEPAAMDYYAAGMGVMYLLFTAGAGAGRFLRERREGTLARMLQSPVSHRQIIAGKFIGIFLTGLLQFAVIILASSLFFRVSWGHPLGVAILAVAAVCGATGIGLLIASLAKTEAAADAASTFVVLIMSALGGSMFPLFSMPPVLQLATRITINSWAMDGFMKLMFAGGGPAAVLLNAAVLIGAGLAFSTFAAFRLSKGVS